MVKNNALPTSRFSVRAFACDFGLTLEQLIVLTMRETRLRYRYTALGILWSLFKPAMLIAVISGAISPAFNRSMGAMIPRLAAPVILWSFISTALSHASMGLIAWRHLFYRSKISPMCVTVSLVASTAVDFIFSLLLLLAVAWYYKNPLFVSPIAFVGVSIASFAFVLLLGHIFAILSALYADFKHLIGFLVQIWFFATPTIYLPNASSAVGIQQWNPLSVLVNIFRASNIGGEISSWEIIYVFEVLGVLAISCVLLGRGTRAALLRVL